MTRPQISLLCAIVILSLPRLGSAAEQLTHHRDELQCGVVTARLRTTCVEQLRSGFECVSQSLQLANRAGVTKNVPLDIRLVPSSAAPGRTALDGYVAEWTCVQSQSGQYYLDLLYACEDSRSDCGSISPSREWEQLVDEQGRVVAGGRTGSKPGSLERLGLGKLLRGTTHVTGVGPNK
jgi:hypothetical protein